MSKPSNRARDFTFDGKVVEILEKGGQRFARVFTPGFFAKVAIDELPDLHLGDLVRVAGRLQANVVSQVTDVDLPATRRGKG